MKINKPLLVATIITLSLASTIFASPISALENIPNIKLARAESLLRGIKDEKTFENNSNSSDNLNNKQNERLARLAVGRIKKHEKLVSKIDLEITNLAQKGAEVSAAKQLFKEYKSNYNKLSASGSEEKLSLKKVVAKDLRNLKKVLKKLEN